MIDLIKGQKPWTRNQIRKRSEAFIKSKQTHGDETMLTRVNDAALLELRPITAGEQKYRDTEYLPRAVEGGNIAAQMQADNQRLIVLIDLQNALVEFVRLGSLLEGESALLSQISDEDGQLVDNPAYLEAAEQFGAVLGTLNAASVDDWQLIAQRQVGAEIPDQLELHLAVIRILPTDDTLKLYVEGQGLGTVDRRYNVETERQRIIDELTPAPEEDPDAVV